MDDANMDAARRAPVWMRVTLGISLALNLLVAGLAVGAALRFGAADGARAYPRVPGGMIYGELPRKDRQELFRQVRDASRDLWRRRREDALAVSARLRAKPFDAAALQELLSAQSDARRAWQEQVQRAWLRQVTQMSDAERADFADRIERAAEQARGRAAKSGGKP